MFVWYELYLCRICTVILEILARRLNLWWTNFRPKPKIIRKWRASLIWRHLWRTIRNSRYLKPFIFFIFTSFDRQVYHVFLITENVWNSYETRDAGERTITLGDPTFAVASFRSRAGISLSGRAQSISSEDPTNSEFG